MCKKFRNAGIRLLKGQKKGSLNTISIFSFCILKVYFNGTYEFFVMNSKNYDFIT